MGSAGLVPFPRGRLPRVIDPVFPDSPLDRCEALEPRLGCAVSIKLETANPVRSFKAHGTELVASALAGTGSRAVACASAGNLGQALAWSGRRRGIEVTVVASRAAPTVKLDRIRALGAALDLVDGDIEAARERAAALARREGIRLVEDSLDIDRHDRHHHRRRRRPPPHPRGAGRPAPGRRRRGPGPGSGDPDRNADAARPRGPRRRTPPPPSASRRSWRTASASRAATWPRSSAAATSTRTLTVAGPRPGGRDATRAAPSTADAQVPGPSAPGRRAATAARWAGVSSHRGSRPASTTPKPACTSTRA